MGNLSVTLINVTLALAFTFTLALCKCSVLMTVNVKSHRHATIKLTVRCTSCNGARAFFLLSLASWTETSCLSLPPPPITFISHPTKLRLKMLLFSPVCIMKACEDLVTRDTSSPVHATERVVRLMMTRVNHPMKVKEHTFLSLLLLLLLPLLRVLWCYYEWIHSHRLN